MRGVYRSLILAALLVALALPAGAGEVRGSVTGVSSTIPAVVFLYGPRVGVPAHGRAVLDQRNQSFVPRVLPVLAGTRVQFPNSDMVFHNVYSAWHGKKFDLGLYPPGASKTIVFDKPGVHDIFCNIHANMSAYVVVLENPYFSTTGRSGGFSIEGVPAGKYEVRVWHPRGQASRTVVVPEKGATDLEFKL